MEVLTSMVGLYEFSVLGFDGTGFSMAYHLVFLFFSFLFFSFLVFSFLFFSFLFFRFVLFRFVSFCFVLFVCFFEIFSPILTDELRKCCEKNAFNSKLGKETFIKLY